MKTSHPPRIRPALFGSILLILALAMAAVGVQQVADSGVSPLLVLWIALVLIGVPLALWLGYQLYGLMTAEYRLDRDQFALVWGGAREILPLHSIRRMEITAVDELPAPRWFSPPGIWRGLAEVDDTQVEYFAAHPGELLLVQAEARAVVISPADATSFREAFVEATRLGSLQDVEPLSERPDLLLAKLWSDPVARFLLLAGLVIPLALLGYLGVRSGALPPSIPFGFTAMGAPGPAAPPGRLLLLPLIGGLVWLADLLLGGYLYRQSAGRFFAYALWALAVMVGLLLWGASLQMLAAAS